MDELVPKNVIHILHSLKRTTTATVIAEAEFEISSESTEVVAGIDTSMPAVMQYVDTLLS